jgi:predicted RNA-binding Zn-ribbon protein involved in translation (DUF1610 family)
MNWLCRVFGHNFVRDSAGWYGPHFYVCLACGKRVRVGDKQAERRAVS